MKTDEQGAKIKSKIMDKLDLKSPMKKINDENEVYKSIACNDTYEWLCNNSNWEYL